MVYGSIADKIRFFNPAFHSMTPEGLNSRLTFLNQCVRPGETIPVIDSDGNSKYNDARNTSFGSPPILILRIGDFYNTKIIPKTVSFAYEPLVLDMNPEGIGVQPMIATVTMGFDFIGGHGLAKPVEQLQNALSFNYYANTEIYDERSVWTDDSFKKIDKELEKQILQNTPNVGNQTGSNQPQNAFGDTIGTIVNFNRVEGGETGEISYQTIMDKMLKTSPEYFTTIVNQLESVVLKYNYGVLQLLNGKETRKYVVGKVYNFNQLEEILIYGKPSIENDKNVNQITNLFKQAYKDIDDDSNPILQKLYPLYTPTDTEKDNIKNNMKKYLTRLSNEYSNNVQTIITELSNYQQNLVTDLIKLEIINGAGSGTNGFDGKKTEKGTPLVYQTSGTDKVSGSSPSGTNNTFDELQADIEKIHDYFIKVNKFLIDKKIITDTYSGETVGNFEPQGKLNNTSENKTFFMIVAREFSDKNKLTAFINYVLTTNFTTPVSNKLRNKFEKVVEDIAKEYTEELRAEEKVFEKLRKDKLFKDYTEGVDEELYPSGKTRILNYTTVITDTTLKDKYTNILKNLFGGGNTDNTKFFIEDINTGKFNQKFN
jgi:hypothetical protein